jgi:hypothetical protein
MVPAVALIGGPDDCCGVCAIGVLLVPEPFRGADGAYWAETDETLINKLTPIDAMRSAPTDAWHSALWILADPKPSALYFGS